MNYVRNRFGSSALRRVGAGLMAVTLCLLLCFARASEAQSTFGSLIGSVQDASGAVVPGAAIQVTNLNDNSKRQTQSNDAGDYQVLNLNPGLYEIVASSPNFKSTTLTKITLDARQQVRADIKLQIGGADQVVNVEADITAINTENGTLGDTKKFDEVVQLPMNYRGGNDSPLAALVAVPGVQQDSNGNVSIGGGTSAQVQYSVDGASTVNIRQNGGLTNMNPSSELISEFKVTQFNNNAEFSQLADVTIITKSGTNHFHGSAFEYLQNSVLDATTFGFPNKAHKAFNTFGGSFTGPVRIPRLMSGGEKTFFFADYEANRRRFTTPLILSVPTAALRAGDLTQLFQGNNPPTINDPSTGKPFPNNQIPAGSISSVATNLFAKYVPLPNFDSGNSTTGNYRFLAPTPANINGYDVRIDRTLTDKQQLYGRWSWKDVDSTFTNNLLPTEMHRESNRNLLVSHNYALTQNLVNEFRFGLTFYTSKVEFPISGADAVQTLGLVGLNLDDVVGVNAFPAFDYSDGTTFTPIGRDKTGVTRSQTLQFTDNLSWILGNHTVKMGADLRRVRYTDLESFGGSNDFGQFTFSASTFSGNAFADLLLGLPSKSYIARSGADTKLHAYQTGLYAQDEWHLSHYLTLSAGLRWQALPPFVSENNNLGAFDPSNGGFILPNNGVARQGVLNAINACPGVNPALPCAPIEKASQKGVGNGLRAFYSRNFQPRLGIAFRPFGDNKTVLRAGFGIYTMTSVGQLSFNTTNINVGIVQTTANLLPSGQAAFTFPNVAAPLTPEMAAGTEDFYQNVNLHFRDPQAAQTSLTVERQVTDDLSLRVSYIGMNSYRMGQTVDLNQQHASVTANDYSQRPYPNWARLLSSENQGNANYQALQTELSQRVRHGLFFQVNHTWAKNLSNAAGDAPSTFAPEVNYGTPVADRFNLRANRGNVVGTRRQRFLVSAIYQLPVGRNRAYLSNMNRIGNAVLGGWEVSSVSLWQTGPYITPITSPSNDSANLNLVFRGAALRPDCIGDPVPANRSLNQYYDLAAYNPVPAPGRIGNCAVGSLRGPGTAAVAGGLAKTFQLEKSLRMRFEATFTNLPNHPNYAPPSVDVTSSSFGQILAAQTADNAGNRTGQLALRLDF